MKNTTNLQLHTALTYVTLKFGHIVYTHTLFNMVYMEARSNYTRFHYLKGKPVLHYGTLKSFERQLAGAGCFVRLHRKYLANMLHVQEACVKDGATLSTGSYLAVSKIGMQRIEAHHAAADSHSQKPPSHKKPKVAV